MNMNMNIYDIPPELLVSFASNLESLYNLVATCKLFGFLLDNTKLINKYENETMDRNIEDINRRLESNSIMLDCATNKVFNMIALHNFENINRRLELDTIVLSKLRCDIKNIHKILEVDTIKLCKLERKHKAHKMSKVAMTILGPPQKLGKNVLVLKDSRIYNILVRNGISFAGEIRSIYRNDSRYESYCKSNELYDRYRKMKSSYPIQVSIFHDELCFEGYSVTGIDIDVISPMIKLAKSIGNTGDLLFGMDDVIDLISLEDIGNTKVHYFDHDSVLSVYTEIILTVGLANDNDSPSILESIETYHREMESIQKSIHLDNCDHW